MRVINVRNVNHALWQGIALLLNHGLRRPSRAGEVLEVPFPVATVYQCPHERVLMLPERDANPFFHFMEALWIIAGREDAEFITHFNRRMVEYLDPDRHNFHGAYGRRLRTDYQQRDQLRKVVDELKSNPESRRAVLQIWREELDLCAVSKDIPCNTQVYLKLREDALHMTVCNRSNDIIWGAYGANVVQFSMLQEYIAAALATSLDRPIRLGPYTQVSDSFHAYTENEQWKRLSGMLLSGAANETALLREEEAFQLGSANDWYAREGYGTQARVLLPSGKKYDEMREAVCGFVNNGVRAKDTGMAMIEDNAKPMLLAWNLHRCLGHTYAALAEARNIQAPDWRAACVAWLERRLGNSRDRR